MKQTKVINKTFVSPQRFAQGNGDQLTAEQLREQIKSLNLPPRPPYSPSTFELFGSDENKYQPSAFMKSGSDTPAFVNTLEAGGHRVPFTDIVRGISKNLTKGVAQPERAAAYAKFFAALSKKLVAAVPKLEASKEAANEYNQDAVVHAELTTQYNAQLQHEQGLSTLQLAAITVAESQEQLKLDTVNANAELTKELEALKRQQNKINLILSKGSK